MATMNLIPLVLIAGRNNPLISLLRVPYDTFNVLHRWLARIVVLEALAHVFAWCIPKARNAGWDAVRLAFMDSSFIRAGLIRAARIVTILYRNVSRDQTTADIESLPDDLLKIALNLPRPWIVTPGQHIYLYIPSISLWTSHPFSICWTDDFDSLAAERETPETTPTNQIYILMRRRTGFTDTLARRVSGSVNQTLSVHALVEGPYGGIHSLDSYGTVVLFAGGVGITHHLLYLRRLVRGQVEGTVAARRITLVWVVRSPDYLEWVEEWIGSIVSIGKGKERESSPTRALQILIYVTGSYNADGMERIRLGGSEEIRVSTGRPSFEKLLAWEMSNQVGAMGVLCCGNGSFSDDVRRVCREAQSGSRVDFFEESFTW
ncbi:uncharacterized protein N7473_007732 [Penicillium subrubescens]|uniref:uncharacterized protein n=1 Tax=Penicillium subrubescens TaxID=1316194 RepID=UPI0025455B65|nr:uncharacterized protein N7473_007732 [Penicillium subrubescens]KAJ5891504.1 hypothetical protein N7473_007732 [Penicillium subrubescens]